VVRGAATKHAAATPHSRLWTFLIEQGQSIVDDLERSSEKIGAGIRVETVDRLIEAARQGSLKSRRSGKRRA